MRPAIFFASRLPGLEGLRQWVNDYGAGRVWVSEYSKDRETLATQLVTEPNAVRIACLRQVQASRYMICVFNGEYGSVIASERVRALGLEVSLLELELVTAVLMRIPIVVLLLGELPNDARTQDLWSILHGQRTVKIDQVVYSHDTIRTRLKYLIDSTVAGHPKATPFITQMSQQRLTSLDNPLVRPDIRFLANVSGFSTRVDADLINELASSAEFASNSYDRLGLLWMALRHCMPVNPSAPREVLASASRALSGWVRAASWAGLHGHSFVGGLAGLNTIQDISLMIGAYQGEGRESVLSAVNGGLASQYYSSSKLMDNRRDKRLLLNRASESVRRAIENGESLDRVLPIKGSILVALGRTHEALAVFKDVLKLRLEKVQFDLGAIGEAEADVGWGYFLTGHVFKGRDYLEAGIQKLRESGNPEFTVKQLKKLAVVSGIHNPARGWSALKEAHSLAFSRGLTDQVQQLEKVPGLGKLLMRERERRERAQ